MLDDHENLDEKGLSKRKATYPELSDYQEVIKSMRSDFESGVFGKEKDGSFESAISQIGKGFGAEDFYPTLEEKANKASEQCHLQLKDFTLIR